MHLRHAAAALVLLAGLPLLALGGPQEAAETDARGVFVRLSGEEETRFVPWEGERTVQIELLRLTRAGGGDLVFAPGDYELETGLKITRGKDIRIAGSGAGTTRLHFPPGPDVRPSILADVEAGATTLRVANAGSMRPGRSYQLYREDLSGDRILEFRVASIDGEAVTLAAPARLMGHVEEIPAGSVVVEEINAFVIWESDRITIERLEIDGIGRGDLEGHTTFCGVYAVGVYERLVRPTSTGLTIRGCHIHDLMGRGVCVYAVKDVLVTGNHIHRIGAQAVEIDHFAQGRVEENTIEEARVGVTLDDAYGTIVRANTVRGCGVGVGLMKHFDGAEFNVGNLVASNLIIGGQQGVTVRPGIRGNRIVGNTFSGLRPEVWIQQDPGSNETEGNVSLEDG